MTYAFEEVLLNEREEGKIEGKIQGKIEGKIEGKLEGEIEGEIKGKVESAVNMIVELNISVSRAMRIANLPGTEQQRITKELERLNIFYEL